MKKATILGWRFAKACVGVSTYNTRLCVGWAYAHGHDVPRSQTEIDALLLAVETCDPGWQRYSSIFDNMSGLRARRWRAFYKAVAHYRTRDAWLRKPDSMVEGKLVNWVIRQDGKGNRRLRFDSCFKWPAGEAPMLSQRSHAVDIVTGYVKNGQILCMITKDYS